MNKEVQTEWGTRSSRITNGVGPRWLSQQASRPGVAGHRVSRKSKLRLIISVQSSSNYLLCIFSAEGSSGFVLRFRIRISGQGQEMSPCRLKPIRSNMKLKQLAICRRKPPLWQCAACEPGVCPESPPKNGHSLWGLQSVFKNNELKEHRAAIIPDAMNLGTLGRWYSLRNYLNIVSGPSRCPTLREIKTQPTPFELFCTWQANDPTDWSKWFLWWNEKWMFQ